MSVLHARRREDLTCWRTSLGVDGAASPAAAAPPTMDVTAVIRRLRAEPLSPRAHPLYLQEGAGPGRMARAASAPASSTPRGRGAPAPDQAHCSAPHAALGSMLVSGRSLDAGPGGVPGGHSFPALSAPGEDAAAEDAGGPGDGAAGAGALRPVLLSGGGAGGGDAAPALARAHASAAAAALAASVGNPFAAAADAGGAHDACGAADERGGVAASDLPAVGAGGGCGAARGGSGAHEAGAAQLGAAVDVAAAGGAARRSGHCSAACSGCLNCVGIKARGGCQSGSPVLLRAVRAAQCVGAHVASARGRRLGARWPLVCCMLRVMMRRELGLWQVALIWRSLLRACAALVAQGRPCRRRRTAARRSARCLRSRCRPSWPTRTSRACPHWPRCAARPPAHRRRTCAGWPAAACARHCAGCAGHRAARGVGAVVPVRREQCEARSVCGPTAMRHSWHWMLQACTCQLEAARAAAHWARRAGRRRPGPAHRLARVGRGRPGAARGVVRVGRRVQPGGVLGRRRQQQQPEPGEQQQQQLRAQPGVRALARLVPVHRVGDRAAGAPALCAPGPARARARARARGGGGGGGL